MNIFGQEPAFWAAVAGAVAIKLLTSPFKSILRAVATVFAAVFSAYFFSDPILDWFGWDPDTYKAGVAALLALTGEGIIRMIMGWSEKPSTFLDFLARWRSGK